MLVAQPGSVTFLDPEQALVVPTDVVVNGSAVCRVPSTDGVDRAALGWISNVPSDSGGADTFQIAEVSRTGVRSPMGQAALPPADARPRALAGRHGGPHRVHLRG